MVEPGAPGKRDSRRKPLAWVGICLWLLLLTARESIAAVPLYPVASIDRIKSDPRGGIGYRLVYYVHVPLDTYWRFKTDFQGSFLSTHEYIREHRLVRRQGATVITENKYSIGPNATYRWLTKVDESQHRLEYRLLNPEACGQRFHYGFIQARAQGEGTLVTQVAYFDFFGATLWARYPWSGGMKDFLRSTAHWEQRTALRLERYYESKPD
jgi:hypothetical protein